MEDLLERNYEGVKQFIFFKTAFNIVDLMIWSYYGILLLKETNSIHTLALNFLFFFFFIWVGYICTSLLLDRLGYLTVFRIAFFIQAIILILMIFSLDEIFNYFLIFSSLKGFSRGIFWVAHNTFYLKEVYPKERSELLNVSSSILNLTNVIIPIFSGAIISATSSYLYVFVISVTLCILSLFVPFKYNIKSTSSINISEFYRILKKPLFWKLAGVSLIENGTAQSMGMIMSFVPFYIIGSEFGVGALMSFAGLSAALFAFHERKKTIRRKVNIGYISWFIYFIAYLFLGLFWNFIFLVVRSIVVILITATADPIKIDLDLRTREKVLGGFRHESAIEMNILLETIYLIARTFAILLFMFILESNQDNEMNIVRIMMVILSFFMFVSFCLFVKISEHKIM